MTYLLHWAFHNGSRCGLLALALSIPLVACGSDGASKSRARIEMLVTGCDGEETTVTVADEVEAHLVPQTPGSELMVGIVIAEGPLTGVTSLDDYLAHRDLIVMAGLAKPARLEAGGIYDLGRVTIGLADGTLGRLYGHDLRVEAGEGDELRLLIAAEADRGVVDECTIPAITGAIGSSVSIEIEGRIRPYQWGDECYSPQHRPEVSQELLPLGCPCDQDVDEAVCVGICEDGPPTAECPPQSIAMFCTNGRWQWGYDGPCGS